MTNSQYFKHYIFTYLFKTKITCPYVHKVKETSFAARRFVNITFRAKVNGIFTCTQDGRGKN